MTQGLSSSWNDVSTNCVYKLVITFSVRECFYEHSLTLIVVTSLRLWAEWAQWAMSDSRLGETAACEI